MIVQRHVPKPNTKQNYREGKLNGLPKIIIYCI